MTTLGIVLALFLSATLAVGALQKRQRQLAEATQPVREIAGILLPHPEDDAWRKEVREYKDRDPRGRAEWLVHGNIEIAVEMANGDSSSIWIGGHRLTVHADPAVTPYPSTSAGSDRHLVVRYRRQVYRGYLQRLALAVPDDLLALPSGDEDA